MTVYEMVTERIIAELEKGKIPWQKPWTGTAKAWSRSTGKAYSFINQLMLAPGEYATFKQIQEAGGKVKKGEKASIVVFWKMHIVKETSETGEKIEKTVPLLRYYSVFNINQCEGIEQKYHTEDIGLDYEPIEECENVLNDYLERSGVRFENVKGDKAFYSPLGDFIRLPEIEQFESMEEYYGVAFHEAAHSTGHHKRLNRIKKMAPFGSQDYSKEELVAELTSSAILNTLGVETSGTFKNNAAYIQSWIRALRNDTRMIVQASSKADKAYNMIMGIEA